MGLFSSKGSLSLKDIRDNVARAEAAALSQDPSQYKFEVPEVAFKAYSKRSYHYVVDDSDLRKVSLALSKEKVLGIDLENHHKYSYNGYLCVMQLTTASYQTFLVDLLAVKRGTVRESLGPLVLQNPAVTKVFHGALHSDVSWLQRDFGLQIVNVVDTQELQKYLDVGRQNNKQKKSANISLATLWKKYIYGNDRVQFLSKEEKEHYQQADWSVRPLSAGMMDYAAHDSHYLIHIAHLQLKHVSDTQDLKLFLQDVNQRVLEVRFQPREDSWSAEGYRGQILRRLMTYYDGDSEDFLVTDHVCRGLYQVREDCARQMDINPETLIENCVLYSISQKRPNNETLLIEYLAEVGVPARDIEILQPCFGKILESIVQSRWEFGEERENIQKHYQIQKDSLNANHQRAKAKEERKQKVMETFTCKKAVYENCRMLAPDGAVLSNCDQKKVQWYVDKGLAEVVSQNPLTIRLKFEPNGRDTAKPLEMSQDDNFYATQRKNQCVVCGKESDFSRFHVVPSLYRQNFPDELKSHRSHDIVLLCFGCHEKASQHQEGLKRKLSDQYNIPLTEKNPSTQLTSLLQGVVKMASSLKKSGHKMPPEKKKQAIEGILNELRNNKDLLKDIIPNDLFQKYVGKECCQEELVAFCASLPIPRLSNKDKQNPHGKALVLLLGQDRLEDFIKLWRQNFVETMRPRYLPEGWRVDHTIQRSFGAHSKFNKEGTPGPCQEALEHFGENLSPNQLTVAH